MAPTSYGGIRGNARASLSASLGLQPAGGQTDGPGGAGAASRPAGMASRGPARIGPDTAPVLLMLVFAEVGALLVLRYVFRNYHGG